MVSHQSGVSSSAFSPALQTSRPTAKSKATKSQESQAASQSNALRTAQAAETAAENAMGSFSSSDHAPNTVSFEHKSETQQTFESLRDQLQPLLNEKEQLTEDQTRLVEALADWKTNAIPGMTKGEARRQLRQIQRELKTLDKSISPLWEEFKPLRQQTLNEQVEARRSALQELFTRYDRTEAVDPEAVKTALIRESSNAQGVENAMKVMDYYAVHSNYDDFENDDSAPTLNINKGMDFVYNQLIANFDDGATTQAAETLFSQLEENPGMTLSAEQEALLEKYGIASDGQGNLINYASKERVTAADLHDINQLLLYQQTQFVANVQSVSENFNPAQFMEMGGRGLQNTAAAFGSSPVRELAGGLSVGSRAVQSALLAERNFIASMDDIQANLAALRAQRTQLQTHKAELEKGLNGLEVKTQALQDEQSVLQETITEMTGLETELDLISYADKASPEKRRLLDRLGIQVQGTGSERCLMVQGQPWTPGAGGRAIAAQLQQESSQLGLRLQNLTRQTQQVQAQLAQVETQLESTETAMQNLETSLENHQESRANYEQELANMRALRADPEAWAQLSPEEQAEVERMLSQADANLQRSNTLVAESRSELEATQALVTETRQLLAEAPQRLENIINALSMLRDNQHLMNQQLAVALNTTPSEADQNAAELIEKAEALSRTLELAPRPESEDVATLIAEWNKILENTREHFTKLEAALNSNQQIEKQRLEHYAAEAKELQEYTSQYLEDAAQMSKEQLLRMTDQIKRFVGNAIP